MAKGHLFRSGFFPLDWTDELVEIKFEIIDVETGLAETRAIFFPLVNRAVKEPESQSVGFFIGGDQRDFSQNDIFSNFVSFVDDEHALGGVARRNDFFNVDKNIRESHR